MAEDDAPKGGNASRLSASGGGDRIASVSMALVNDICFSVLFFVCSWDVPLLREYGWYFVDVEACISVEFFVLMVRAVEQNKNAMRTWKHWISGMIPDSPRKVVLKSALNYELKINFVLRFTHNCIRRVLPLGPAHKAILWSSCRHWLTTTFDFCQLLENLFYMIHSLFKEKPTLNFNLCFIQQSILKAYVGSWWYRFWWPIAKLINHTSTLQSCWALSSIAPFCVWFTASTYFALFI